MPYGAPLYDCIYGSRGMPRIVWEASVISLRGSRVVLLGGKLGTRAVTLKKWKKYDRGITSTYQPKQNLTKEYVWTPYRHPPELKTTIGTIIIDDVFLRELRILWNI